MMKSRRTVQGSVLRRLAAGAFFILWTILVLFPNPVPFALSLQRSFAPPIDPVAVRDIAVTLPDDPAAIAAFSGEYVTYKTAWEEYGRFWYFPTVSEVVERRAGDCQAIALLSASILTAKGIPYIWHYSLTHAWIEYPGKAVNDLEDPAVAIASDSGGGWLNGLPQRLPVREVVDQLTAYHWTPMPEYRKLLLLMGLLLAIVLGEWPTMRRGVAALGNLLAPKARDQV